MAKKRITELATETTLKDGQYVAIDHATDGTKKYDIGAELTDLKEELASYEDIFTGDVDESVQNWLDAHPEATTTVVDGSITEQKLSNDVKKKLNGPVYIVTNYGILPNVGDIYEELFNLIKDHVSQTGGIVFFPKGKYTLSYTIFIPSNTIFIGEGEATEIYFNESDATFGVAFSNCGSNVGIENMKINTVNSGTIHNASLPGSIGFSNVSANINSQPYNHSFEYVTDETIENLWAVNIWCDSNYILQTEPSGGEINGVRYENIYAPDAMVSVLPNTNSGIVKNVIMRNISCDILRIGNGANGYNIYGEDIRCTTAKLMNSHDMTFNRFHLDATVQNNDFFGTWVIQLNGNSKFTDSDFYGGNSKSILILEQEGIKQWHNCKFVAPYTAFSRDMTTVPDDDKYDYFYNCDIKGNQVGEGTPSNIIGYGDNNTYDSSIRPYIFGSDYYIDKKLNISKGLTSGYPNRLVISQNAIKIQAACTYSTSIMFTLPAGMSRKADEIIPITIWNGNDNSAKVPSWAKIDSSGNINIDIIFTQYGNYNRCAISCMFLVDNPTPSQIYATGYIGQTA